MNPRLYLIQSTAKVILHIFSEFQGDFSGNKRVIRVNPWVELVQSTTKVILHISTEFQGDLFEIKELLE